MGGGTEARWWGKGMKENEQLIVSLMHLVTTFLAGVYCLCSVILVVAPVAGTVAHYFQVLD